MPQRDCWTAEMQLQNDLLKVVMLLLQNKFKCTAVCGCGDECQNHESLVNETGLSTDQYSESEFESEE